MKCDNCGKLGSWEDGFFQSGTIYDESYYIASYGHYRLAVFCSKKCYGEHFAKQEIKLRETENVSEND